MQQANENNYQKLLNNVQKGIEGKSIWIPIGFEKLDHHIGIGQKIYTLIGGISGGGKTSLCDVAYVLNPYKWLIANKDTTDIRIKWIYRSMERSKIHKIAKWVCLKLYEDYKILIDVPTLLGWGSQKSKVSTELYSKIIECKDYFEKMFEVVEIIDGSENPTGIFHHAIKYANNNGKTEQLSEFEKVYTPTNPHEVRIIVSDHIGKLKSEVNGNIRLTGKLLIDKHSEYMGLLRDFYGFSPVDVSQFNRGIESTYRAAKEELRPKPSDFKDSGDPYENCDVCLALFNPYKYKIEEYMGYKIGKMVSKAGHNRFRTIECLKNSYGMDDFRVPIFFLGENGICKELPSSKDFTEQNYLSLQNL